MNNPKYYQIVVNLGGFIKTIEIFAQNDNWDNYTFRINKLLFGKSVVKQYKIISSKIINENIGL